MFTIAPSSIHAVRAQLGASASACEHLLGQLPDIEATCTRIPCPIVQLSRDEISLNDVDTLLGYAGIASANAPIGLPLTFAPLNLAPAFLLFPLAGLYAHLAAVAKPTVSDYEQSGTLDSFLESRDRSGAEYLVAGVVDCIRWCLERNQALCIRW